ncbi:helix-turn-helix domain-containing protein [Aliikangiella sp. G2MR2-5]|uniref:helix-turn-helix domain-containing protein n=1 Tax=Aliikangiella sp. G2MR2-5 TaxID=2788943 RepID=UPI0018AA0AC6|nr:helix-turn-helix domain-containing protein [Aliikangiella sp. G2MR2-5]
MQSLSEIEQSYSSQDFKLDFSSQRILHARGSIRLRCKLWELLILLLESKGSLVQRNLIIDRLWLGNYYTGPSGLNHSICHLRAIIKKIALPFEIVTVPKRGYILASTEKKKIKNLTFKSVVSANHSHRKDFYNEKIDSETTENNAGLGKHNLSWNYQELILS